MDANELSRRRIQTARAYIDAKNDLSADIDAWLDGILALRTTDCIFALRPTTSSVPDMNNDQYRRFVHELRSAQHLAYSKVIIQSISGGESENTVIVKVLYDAPTWPCNREQEVEFVLTMTEDGEKIKRDEVRLEPTAFEQWRQASNAYLERVRLQATQTWLKEQNARWL